jgi:hypothetical protein
MDLAAIFCSSNIDDGRRQRIGSTSTTHENPHATARAHDAESAPSCRYSACTSLQRKSRRVFGRLHGFLDDRIGVGRPIWTLKSWKQLIALKSSMQVG